MLLIEGVEITDTSKTLQKAQTVSSRQNRRHLNGGIQVLFESLVEH